MNPSTELFWKIAIPVYAVLFTIIGINLLLLWMLDVFKDEIECVLSRIPAVQRYRERCFWESLKDGELCLKLSRTDSETGAVIERIVPITPTNEVEADPDEEETLPSEPSADSDPQPPTNEESQ